MFTTSHIAASPSASDLDGHAVQHRKHVLAAAAAVAVALTAATAPAYAAPAKLAPERAQQIDSQLGGESAGTYYDKASGNMVVTVTSQGSAKKVRASGGIARVVRYSGAALERVVDVLQKKASVPGTAWGIDPVEDKVVVTADPTVSAANLGQLAAVAKLAGAAMRISRATTPIMPAIAGGDRIVGSINGECSLGFNVVRPNGNRFFLTAGHCAGFRMPTFVKPPATTVQWSYPGDDMALVRYDGDTPSPGDVDLYDGRFKPMNSAAKPYVGQWVKKSGKTTFVTNGQVLGIDQTINTQDGRLHDMIRTDVCSEGGDSGGPLFSGDVALGLLSTRWGDCDHGGETWFQPVKEALNVFNVTLR
jgi:streptogrisin D